MNSPRTIAPCLIFNKSCREWAYAFGVSSAVLLAAVAPVKADHFYGAWTQEFDTTSHQSQEARAVATDSRGNVCVAGESIDSSGMSEWYVAKYDGLDGHLVASAILGPNNSAIGQVAPVGDSFVRAIAIDSQDNIIVAGGSTLSISNQEDFETIKFSPNLTEIWARSLNGSNSGLDEVKKIVIGASDSVYVVGRTEIVGHGTDMATVKYNSSGVFQFERTYNSTGNIDDIPVDLAIDSSGAFWVTGYSNTTNGKVAHTLQYDSTNTLVNDFSHTVTNGDSTPAGIVLNSVGSAFITTTDIDSSGNHSFFTGKYAANLLLWSNSFVHSSGDGLAQAAGIAIGSDNNPVVAGSVDSGDNFDITEAVVLKYPGNALGSNPPTWTTIDPGLSPEDPDHPGFPAFSTEGLKVHVDGANNVVITGDSDGTDDGNPKVYVAKFDGTDGARGFFSSFDGSSDAGGDFGVDVTTDAAGNIAICGTESRIPPGDSSNVGIHGIVTQKYQRLVAETNDPLPPAGGTAQKIVSMDAAAIADTGDLAAKITLAKGSTRLSAILTQGPAGGSGLAAVQKQPAPNVPGFANATFSSFGDPILSPDGHLAFTAKLGGVPSSKAASLWTDLSGSLKLALQQGAPLPGLTTNNVSSIMSIAMRNGQLLALVKVNGSAKTNTVLVSLNAGNNGTKLLRTGDPITVGGDPQTTIKSITVLSPPPNEAGAGDWNGDGNAVAKAVLADKRTVIFKASSGGVLTPLLYTAQAASEVTANATWKTFSFPAIGPAGGEFAALGTINPESGVNGKDDNALVVSAGGGSFSLVAREGSPFSGIVGTSYVSLGNPLVFDSGVVGFLATIKSTAGSGVKVTASSNKVLALAVPGIAEALARTGDTAPTFPGDTATQTFSSFTSLALSGGGPLFVAKLAGKGVSAKNDLGVFAQDSNFDIRRLLRKGDHLGAQIVSSFTLLNASPQAFSAARSFNKNGSVVMLVHFKDHSTGILELGIP